MQRLMRLLSAAGCVLFAVIAALAFADVIGRYAFARVLPGGYDLAQQLQAIAVFWGIALACHARSHITVDLLWERASGPWRGRLDRFAAAVTGLAFGAVFVCSALQLPKMLRSAEIIPDLRIPLWPFTLLAIAGPALAVAAVWLAPPASDPEQQP